MFIANAIRIDRRLHGCLLSLGAALYRVLFENVETDVCDLIRHPNLFDVGGRFDRVNLVKRLRRVTNLRFAKRVGQRAQRTG